MSEKKKLFLLDAMALIYRAYFALNKNPRINSKGMNTSAILGFANTLYDVLKNEQPTHIGVAFDTSAPTLRSEEYLEYKANRQKMPEDIAVSLPYIKKLIEAFNIPILAVDSYEADDVIGTLAKEAEKKGFITYMMTPDKDFGQLVSENTFIYKPPRMGNKAEILGVDEICRKYKIKQPEQLTEIMGLWGDSSDNIPGVPGVGEKTAVKLISEYDTIDNLITHTDDLKGKLKENIEQYIQQAFLSKHLATIILDVPIDFNEEILEVRKPDDQALKTLFDELEFRVFAKRVFTDLVAEKPGNKADAEQDLFSMLTGDESIGAAKLTINDIKHNYYLVDTPDKRINLIKDLESRPSFCFDTESTGLDPNKADLVGIAFCFKPEEAYYLPLPDDRNDAIRILNDLKPVFENEKTEKTGQNLKYDISLLRWYNIEVKGKLFDTMLAHYLIEPDLRHNMDYLAETYLNYKPVSIETLIGKKGKQQKSMRTVDIDTLKEYACEDADITLQLKLAFEPMLVDTKTDKLFKNIEIPLVPVLASMEAEGIKLDTSALKEYSVELEKDIIKLEKEIYEQAGVDFNIASPKQLGGILFERLKITDKPKLTKTKQYSTSEDVLIKLVNKHPVIKMILDYRSLTKLKSTYVDALPALINPKDGRIHTSYNQAVAATGRLSSNNPNMQNIPVRTERGREIRRSFVPRDENHVLLSADYSQIELRIMAELSQDENMMESFRNDEDIHSATAARVYGVPIDDVTKDMRRMAKTVNFGIIYGISAFGLSERLNIPRRDAADIIDQYFAQYPGVRSYMEKTIDFAREHGYVETIMGRRRYLRDINSNNATVRGFAERNAINAPVQGSSADMIKIAMINIYNAIHDNNLKSKMILQVHDELVFDTYKKEIEIVKEIVLDKMVNAIPVSIPIKVDINTGNNWLEAH
ncbi:MAG: DNA polymerase I [Bacteroidetes bacterium]|nr:DNA polymerase I [Bacteroidota bacterium]